MEDILPHYPKTLANIFSSVNRAQPPDFQGVEEGFVNFAHSLRPQVKTEA